MRILVVEDDLALRHIAVRLMTHHGCAVATAPDGAAAIGIILGSLPFHLVVSEVVMPRMGGFALVRWLAEHRLEGQQIRDGVRLMRKPYAHADLIGAIQQLLGDGE
jgi:CheY-like chemotaxis protein